MPPQRYILSRRARRDLERAPEAVRSRVLATLDRYIENPLGVDVRKLQGKQNEYRIRTGDWRILFESLENGRTVGVLRVLPRGRAYRD
jgi:mRNA interferase RelE/StbE